MRAIASILVAAAIAFAPARAHADASDVFLYGMGTVAVADLAFAVADVTTMALHRPTGKVYPAVEVALGLPTVALGFTLAVLAFGDTGAPCGDTSRVYCSDGIRWDVVAAGGAALLVGGFITAHGIWSLGTDGLGNSARPDMALVPTVSVGGGGLALVGRF